MSDEKMAYLFRCRICKGMQYVVVDSERSLKRSADSIASMLKDGLKMLRVTNEDVRNARWCDCR